MNVDAMLSVLSDDAGATSIEYSLIAALVAVVIIGSLGSLGSALNETFIYVSDQMPQTD
jgi:pilus assembly protein Flp/PilA